jgi:DNA helicase-2/ATP-dependent DNA helicase PcrA
MAMGMPYRVYGGLRFFDRMEIKNALAYLHLSSATHFLMRSTTKYASSCSLNAEYKEIKSPSRAHETLRDNTELLAFYRDRFQHVHVDEFQDTNTIQYAWLRLLTEGKDNLFVLHLAH